MSLEEKQKDIRKAAKLADCPKVALRIIEVSMDLEEARLALVKDLNDWADVKERKEGKP